MSLSNTFPHEISRDLRDPLLDLYHPDGAEAPEEQAGKREKSVDSVTEVI